ncbi:hypothetical protein ACIPRD_12085 [Streptomyces sp. NPDC090108]|uniref:hypothetical protein n=1 Tax=Streptomyces sp. NPDC090108 TaxID=3365947 RepID=UPI00380C1643
MPAILCTRSGVATAGPARGRGTGTAVRAFVPDALVAGHGLAAPMVDGCDTAAVRLCRDLGLSWRPLAAARVTDS